jgi:hypothetical protein
MQIATAQNLADKKRVRRQSWFLEFEIYVSSFSGLKVKKKSPKKEPGKNARIACLVLKYGYRLKIDLRCF